MKKLHIIKTKSFEDIDVKARGKILPVLEKETLSWAKKMQKNAYKATQEIQKKFKKNPDPVRNKYFKYLRKLLMMKLDALEESAYRNNEKNPKLNEQLVKYLDIQSLRVPEHISCSSIALYEFCPRKWFYRYALGVKFPKTAPLHFGSAFDEAINFYFEEKIAGRKAPLKKVHEVFWREFDKDADEVNRRDDDPKQLRKNGPVILDKYINEFDRITAPTDVQTEIRVILDNGGMLLGYIDILEENAVVDTKTAKKKWQKGRFAKHLKELQPKAYSLWFLQEFERMPHQFRYQIVTKETDKDDNATPDTQLIDFTLKKYELEAFRRRIQAVWDDIILRLNTKDSKGNLRGMNMFPAQAEYGPVEGRGPGMVDVGYLCCKKYCDYALLCEKEGLRISEEWVSKTKDKSGYHRYKD